MQYEKKIESSLVGIEPTTFGLEVQRAILCAKGTWYRDIEFPLFQPATLATVFITNFYQSFSIILLNPYSEIILI